MTDIAFHSPNPILAASTWFEGALTGTIATVSAVLAVACVGLLMLSGRVDVRRGAHVILGCFIIFGASTIAAGIQASIFGSGERVEATELPLPPPLVIPQTEPQSSPSAHDPYAGAGLAPTR